jgi:hypothetical protein
LFARSDPSGSIANRNAHRWSDEVLGGLREEPTKGIQGVFAVVRPGEHDCAAVSQIGATLVELLRPASGIVVGTTLPPDVRLAGKPAVMGSRLGSLRAPR